MSHDQPGSGDPRGGRDDFDHFFTDRNGGGQPPQDPDATVWGGAGEQHGQAEQGAYTQRMPARPYEPQQYDAEYDAGYANQPREDYGRPQGGGYYDEPPRNGSKALAPILVIVASLIVIALVAFFALHHSSSKDNDAATTPLPSQTSQSTPSTTQSQSQSQSPSQTQSSPESSTDQSSSSDSPSSSANPLFPSSATACPGTSEYATGPKTSCPFAAVVASTYAAKKDSSGNATFSAVSPETGDTYQVSCTSGDYVTCVTTTKAIVYIAPSQ
ncbi:hypothetical protein [Rudaeicoccus suwonensis]|uniref:Uncharacterized protein n=1 Tax=Rudaeicoccus suwonensis TaxID=657409 RepID=A0A561E411_9MICO|nr:hypothetical protein [Rudaeicoccus suwonensis]TWE10355.1 hypothetical protein BKA23_2712 [Rudaeicoccus suwonensis]